MTNIMIFSAGTLAKKYYHQIKDNEDMNVLNFIDNDKIKQGSLIDGIEVVSPESIVNSEFDKIIIVMLGYEEVVEQLIKLGIDHDKIEIADVTVSEARANWLKNYAQFIYETNIKGSIAEVGVFRGEFAKIINTLFPDRTLYLFDSFEGFSQADVAYENGASIARAGYYSGTSIEVVMNKMTHPENCIVKKGFFPETATGVEDAFCFVNLDLDLYKPTLEGLRFFWDKMVDGGIILIHDYFNPDYPRVKDAVWDFEAEKKIKLKIFPVGDFISIAIIK